MAGKDYAAAVVDKGKSPNVGSLHIHVVVAWFVAMAQESTAPPLLKDVTTKMLSDGPPFIQQMFPYFRVSPTYKPEVVKLERIVQRFLGDRSR